MSNSRERPRERPRPRFAPIPIETTFERYRKTVPPGELTPSPSPRSASPRSPRVKRRFAPQLVESSVRRSRRAGDEGPATRPTDKTDITPYTNHIYAPKPRRRPSHEPSHDVVPVTPSRQKGHARRESCDDEIAGGVFDLVARDAQRKLQEVAMSAFPNSGQRIGGAEHFYVREGSDDDSPRGRTTVRGPWAHLQSRRNSSQEDISWAFKEMQEHAHLVSREMERMSTMDLDNMSMDSPPCDAMGLTRGPRASMSSSPMWSSRMSSGSLVPIGETHMPLLRAESPLATIGEAAMPYLPPESPLMRPIGESYMPYIPSAPPGKSANMPYVPASQIPAETNFQTYSSPFYSYGQERDLSLERARNQHRMRIKTSPPMLGDDLTFRMCPSPKMTKLEPDHLWDLEKGQTAEQQNRDPSEQRGLWRGYCFTNDQTEKLARVDRPAMLHTPLPLRLAEDPFSQAFGATAPVDQSEQTSPTGSATRAGTVPLPGKNDNGPQHMLRPGHRTRTQEPKGLHMLQGLQNLDERLRKEKAAAELEEKIAAEFDDKFVTQVYNYLSLGYPALARQYDEELSKINRISVEELEQDDDAIMDHLPGGKKTQPTGHIMLDSEEKDGIREEDRCPRWKALKLYIYEWARQHPDLNAISPLAWGVRERRGSWGI
ncbi:hypothetical protein B0T26DRAFT_655826 [Lasiosphaeria miniovina]|uniref:Uncharacterized protein n=1 Tax=Lasiosphaeria miniovina TaxID=1954250 RepID=A0AA39ZYD2_9PEZI|nr:uncharacterized protein B0T26DRAFT_655826 [Lasiosphaeria miniovina]KAK0705932.1 hypothetical protein B0T26DRAFT_655826 [Lasiosphaeria miniovina]